VLHSVLNAFHDWQHLITSIDIRSTKEEEYFYRKRNDMDIGQTIHQVLSDPALQGVGTIISMLGSGAALFSSFHKASSTYPYQQLLLSKKA